MNAYEHTQQPALRSDALFVTADPHLSYGPRQSICPATIAVQGGEIIGTLSANRLSEGSLGVLEERYGMRASPAYLIGNAHPGLNFRD